MPPDARVMTLHTNILPTHPQVNESPCKGNRTFQSQKLSGAPVISAPTFIVTRRSQKLQSIISYNCSVNAKECTFYKISFKYK
jgi:hypothetical protein